MLIYINVFPAFQLKNPGLGPLKGKSYTKFVHKNVLYTAKIRITGADACRRAYGLLQSPL